MNAISFLVRKYCKKSFKLPKINFIYKDVDGPDNKEACRIHNDPSAKNDSFKNRKSHQRSNPKFFSVSTLNTSADKTFRTDNEAPKQRYSSDLLEVEDNYELGKRFNKRRETKTMSRASSWNKNKYNYQSSFHIQEDREIVYGIFPVLFALQTKKRSFYKLFIKHDSSAKNGKVQLIQEICLKNDIPTQVVPKTVLQQLTNFDAVRQGVCLEASRLPMFVTDENSLESLDTDNIKCWMYLNGINDPMNLGAIIRTAYFLGVEKVMCSSAHSCPVTSVVSKASAGIAELYPIHIVPNDESYLLASQKFGWQIVSSSSSYVENGIDIQNFHPKKNVLLVIGNEGRGISKEILKLSDVCVSIPPHDKSSSEMLTLNASAASSIILFSIMSKLKLIGGA